MKNPYIHLLTESYHYAGEKKGRFLLAIGFSVVANFIILAQPYFFGQVLNTLQNGGADLGNNFLIFLILYSITPFFFWVFHGTGRILERTTSVYICKNFKENMFRMITEFPFSWHTDNHSGETINKLNKAGNALERFSDNNFVYVENIVKFIGSILGITFISWYLGLTSLIIGILIIGVILRFDKKLTPQYANILDKEHKIASLLHDYISNIRTIITLHCESLAKNVLVTKITDLIPFQTQKFKLNELKWFSTSMCVELMIFLIIVIYAYVTIGNTGVILAGNLVILYQYLERFSYTFYNFAFNYEDIVKMNTELKTIDSLISDYATIVQNRDKKTIKNWQSIEIQKWNFKYQKHDEKHTVSNVSMNIKKGLKIAMIGESGSGKSTMASLLKGLYRADSGNLEIDGKNIKNLHTLSNITTLIPQDPEIFENTLLYNITFGIETDMINVEHAVKLARFDSVLGRLPRGLETNIKEKGINLSGGEKQRLALARGLFMGRNRDIIIMDEPTSSVDPVNEIAIYKNIFAEFPDKCIISALHKLHLLPLFDIIYVFRDGEVIESGTFKKLQKSGGMFTDLWKRYTESL